MSNGKASYWLLILAFVAVFGFTAIGHAQVIFGELLEALLGERTAVGVVARGIATGDAVEATIARGAATESAGASRALEGASAELEFGASREPEVSSSVKQDRARRSTTSLSAKLSIHSDSDALSPLLSSTAAPPASSASDDTDQQSSDGQSESAQSAEATPPDPQQNGPIQLSQREVRCAGFYDPYDQSYHVIETTCQPSESASEQYAWQPTLDPGYSPQPAWQAPNSQPIASCHLDSVAERSAGGWAATPETTSEVCN